MINTADLLAELEAKCLNKPKLPYILFVKVNGKRKQKIFSMCSCCVRLGQEFFAQKEKQKQLIKKRINNKGE